MFNLGKFANYIGCFNCPQWRNPFFYDIAVSSELKSFFILEKEVVYFNLLVVILIVKRTGAVETGSNQLRKALDFLFALPSSNRN